MNIHKVEKAMSMPNNTVLLMDAYCLHEAPLVEEELCIQERFKKH